VITAFPGGIAFAAGANANNNAAILIGHVGKAVLL
jgi:hypothetical protein